MGNKIIATMKPKSEIIDPSEVHHRTEDELSFRNLAISLILAAAFILTCGAVWLFESFAAMALFPVLFIAGLVVFDDWELKRLKAKHNVKYIGL